MKISVIPHIIIPVTCLKMLSACNSALPDRQSLLQQTTNTIPSRTSIYDLRQSLGASFKIANQSYNQLKKYPDGDRLGKLYLSIIANSPKPAAVEALNSILASNAFRFSSNKVALLEILSSGFNQDRAARFEKCFESDACQEALKSLDTCGQTLLFNLRSLAVDPIAPKLEAQRGAIVAALFEFACGLRPLDQGDSYGCGPIACLLTVSKSAEIIRLVRGLCSPAGSVRLASGEMMQACASSLKDNKDREQGSAIRILASSLLDHSNGKFLRYSRSLDLNHIGLAGFPGMISSWALKALEDLNGKPHTILYGKEASIDAIKKSIDDSGYAVLLRASAPCDWHWIVVRKIEGNWAYFQDPNGSPVRTEMTPPEIKTLRINNLLENLPVRIPKISAVINRNSLKNFPEVAFGDPLKAIYRVPLDSLQKCTKSIIVPQR